METSMTYFIMANTYTWWRGDELPALAPLPDFRCERIEDVQLLAALIKVETGKIEDRLKTENNAYVAFFQDKPAGYGWSGAKSVGVADVFWPLTPPDRGLWDFATLDAWRGRGIYPHLLQAVLRREEREAERFWIGHRADNNASKRGIVKAGFQLVNFAVLTPEGQLRLAPRGNLERSLGDPQGRHFGFVDVTDEDLAVFDFDNRSNDEIRPAK